MHGLPWNRPKTWGTIEVSNRPTGLSGGVADLWTLIRGGKRVIWNKNTAYITINMSDVPCAQYLTKKQLE